MARVNVKLDHAGIRHVLASAPVAAMVNAAAGRIAASVRARTPPGTDVVVDVYTTDRAAAAVTIRDAAGKLWQARDGVLTRAAGEIGAEVRTR